MDIYIKPSKKVNVTNSKSVTLKDIAEVFTESPLRCNIENTEIFRINSDKKKCYLVTVMDIVEVVSMTFPGFSIQNVGESDTIIEYSSGEKKTSKLIEYIKVFCVSLVLLTGASTAIMSFHTDSQIPQIFKNYYYIFFNEKVDNPYIIDIPYSIGMAAGIIVFFNHFSKKKITDDPTPIEVEMTMYESQAADSVIDSLNTKRKEDINKQGEVK